MSDVPEITINDWLAQRLTPAKQKEARWVEYAKVLQQYWEENFDPVIKDIEDSRSIYTASDEALARRLSELGDFYPVDSLIGGEDKILAIAWRNLALYFKDTRYLFDSTILRKFGSLDVKWVELYHKKSLAYGEEFLGASRITTEGNNLDDYFLTCHGSVDVDQPTLDSLGIPLDVFVDQAWKEILAIRPAHIVFHGVQVFEEIPTTIPMGSFLKEADIVLIKPDLFDLVIEDSYIFHPTFIRTAEVIVVNWDGVANEYPETSSLETYGDTATCDAIFSVEKIIDTASIATKMTDKFFEKMINAFSYTYFIGQHTYINFSINTNDPEGGAASYFIVPQGEIDTLRVRFLKEQWASATAYTEEQVADYALMQLFTYNGGNTNFGAPDAPSVLVVGNLISSGETELARAYPMAEVFGILKYLNVSDVSFYGHDELPELYHFAEMYDSYGWQGSGEWIAVGGRGSAMGNEYDVMAYMSIEICW